MIINQAITADQPITAKSEYNEGRHLDGLRGLDQVPLGTVFTPGRFGRMFPELRPHEAGEGDLIRLGEAMTEDPAEDDNIIPQGFTYLGQFVDHDITFDTTALSEQPRDPQAIFNFRTPQLELDSLYGTGPRGMPHLYERDDRAKFVIGLTSDQTPGGDATVPVSLPHDLPRMAGTGFAVIGDPRNDENLVVAQTHLAFLKFHNALVGQGNDFDTARRLVRWHYQWIVLHDFVAKLVGRDTIDDVLANGRRFYKFQAEPFIPVEFAVAAYRLGHSMVRDVYDYNRVFTPAPGGVVPASLGLLFRFSGRSGDGGGTPIPSDWIIDWRRFFEVGSGATVGMSRRLNPRLASALQNVPGVGSLAAANLVRGLRRGLPSGQSVAYAMRMQPLPPSAFDGQGTHPDVIARELHFDESTPLWYYILKEAEHQHQGTRLGDVGSRIVAEVFIGLLEGDPESYLAQNPAWRPTLPGQVAGDFTMADLLQTVNELNPIG